MTITRMSLRNFLIHAKSTLQSAIKQQQRVTIVIGNESCDLDSFSSSVLYSYIRSHSSPPHPFSQLYIPLLNIPSSDISIRPEFLHLLPSLNISPSHLLTLDDLPTNLEKDLPPENTQWLLVDHNALQGKLGQLYGSRVRGVIDHHDDEKKVPQDTGDEPRVIEKSGSCSSLVTNYLHEAWDALDRNSGKETAAKEFQQQSGELAKLALASVLIDTANLKDESKTTDNDIQAVKFLEAKIAAASQSKAETWNRGQFFQGVRDAKNDIDSLSLKDVLRKDYKAWEAGGLTLGVSSVVKPLSFLLDKAKSEENGSSAGNAFNNFLIEFAEERNLDLYAIGTAFSKEGQFARELLLWALNDKAKEAAERFGTDTEVELGLEEWSGEISGSDVDKGWRRIWRQTQTQHSRKRVAPLLREAMA